MRFKINILFVEKEYYSNISQSRNIIIPDSYNINNHQEEVSFANYIINKFGGTIELLPESNRELRPDFIWNGKLWDFKTVSTKSSIDSQVRKGIKQILSNVGGLFLNIDRSNLKESSIISIIADRVSRENKRILKSVDIILIKNGKVLNIIRYKK